MSFSGFRECQILSDSTILLTILLWCDRYAEPPIGKMRWRPPADLELPAEDFLARSFGPSCPQYGGQLANASTRCFTLSPTDYCSEDCLTLNVWRPHSYRGTNPLPILFWIHGGGFTQGGSSEFNGTSLASLHSVVVISTNYRLVWYPVCEFY